MSHDAFTDDFDAPALDTEIRIPSYLPQWSSRAESASRCARMELSPRSMAAVWMVRLEDEPSRCAEICKMMVAVFDFPDKAASAPAHHVPELAVDWVRGRPSPA